VGDDGAGLPRNKILAKARERGLQVSEQMTDQEVFHLIFEAGFSTAEQVTDVSGRGVGMDVVRRNIQSMGGRVEIDSMLGVGTDDRSPASHAGHSGRHVDCCRRPDLHPAAVLRHRILPAADG
jgi:two-component sensor histidine kinase